MTGILPAIKRALPNRVREVLGNTAFHLRNKQFEPYLKKKTVEGVSFDFWIGDSDGRDWYDLHCTDPEWIEARFVRDHLIEPGDVVLEAGGHHGCTAILLSNWVGDAGKVVTFEASKANADIIEKNIKLNGLSNVTLERKAVGAKPGTVTFNDVSNASVTVSGKGHTVELINLDKYADLHPTVLKIDVEGFEGEVLKGAQKILSTRPKIALEIHTDVLSRYGTSVEELFRLIGVENYKCWVQWADDQEPEAFDLNTPILSRCHLFCVPLASESV